MYETSIEIIGWVLLGYVLSGLFVYLMGFMWTMGRNQAEYIRMIKMAKTLVDAKVGIEDLLKDIEKTDKSI